MNHEDYSESELDNIINNELLVIYYSHLMKWEIEALERFTHKTNNLTRCERDWLIGTYDRIRDNSGD